MKKNIPEKKIRHIEDYSPKAGSDPGQRRRETTGGRRSTPSLAERSRRQKESSGRQATVSSSRKTKTRTKTSASPDRIQASKDAEYNAKQRRLDAFDRKRARSRSISLSIFVIFVMIITVLFILKIMQTSASKPRFSFFQHGEIEHKVSGKALIVRQEETVKTPVDGYLKPLIQAGSRVSLYENIAVMVKEAGDRDMLAFMNYEDQISDMQFMLVSEGKGPGAEIIYEEAAEEIGARIDFVRHDLMDGNISGLATAKSAIKLTMENRQNKLKKIDFNDTNLKELIRQKEILEDKMGFSIGYIKATVPGIISYGIDGLEDSLDFKNIANLDIDDVKKILQKEDGAPYGEGSYLEKDQPALKIISNINQYLALVLPDDSEDHFDEGSIHRIHVPDSGTHIDNCKVVKKLITGGEIYVVFVTDRQVSRFAQARVLDVNLSTRTVGGIKIPYTAIYNRDKHSIKGEINIVIDGIVRKMEVKIIDHDNEYAIIEAMDETEAGKFSLGYLVKNPDSVKEGEKIG